MCPAEGRERTRRLAGNTKKCKTCSQQKGTRIKRFWNKHFRQRNKTIFTEYDRKKSRLSSVNIILFLCLKAFTSQACYVPAFLLGTSIANLCAPWGWRVLVHALLPGTRRNILRQTYMHINISYNKTKCVFIQSFSNKFIKAFHNKQRLYHYH